jgi:Na+-transporting NADH:ubiquinone oxidoreductase subunit NqrE
MVRVQPALSRVVHQVKVEDGLQIVDGIRMQRVTRRVISEKGIAAVNNSVILHMVRAEIVHLVWNMMPKETVTVPAVVLNVLQLVDNPVTVAEFVQVQMLESQERSRALIRQIILRLLTTQQRTLLPSVGLPYLKLISMI